MDTEPLVNAVFRYPAIDNHAHPLISEKNRDSDAFPLQGIVSEATGNALTNDARYTLASYRATVQLSKLFGLKGGELSWDSLKKKRDDTDYIDLCRTCFKPTGIQCILLDDGLSGVADLAESNAWHDQFTSGPCKRIVRIESVAEDILRTMLPEPDTLSTSIVSVVAFMEELMDRFKAKILSHARDDHVAAFKSVVCYRTGLDIATSATYEELSLAALDLLLQYKATESICLKQKVLNDYLVRLALQIAGQYHKASLGDSDIRLTESSPAYMQPIIEAYPDTAIVLLHAAYPYTRDAGYLTSVYKNVYLDFGEVFPCLSMDGQCQVLRQMFELAPTNKLLFSTDGHWWPETYYLATVQARVALFTVLEDAVHGTSTVTTQQAVEIGQNVLFHNANRLYNLSLGPDLSLLGKTTSVECKPRAHRGSLGKIVTCTP